MKALIIKETSFSPSVILDPHQNKFEVSGSSRPENAVQFYAPLLNWLEEFGRTESSMNINFIFYFDYLNSVSVKLLFDSFKILESINSSSKSFTITWYYNFGDIDMKETGEEYQKLLKLPFSIIARESKT